MRVRRIDGTPGKSGPALAGQRPIYEKAKPVEGYVRRDGITDFILNRARSLYGDGLSHEDVFFFVYGWLHNPQYRERFANDLRKSLPRLPLPEDAADFDRWMGVGRRLAYLHLNYESVEPYAGCTVTGAEHGFFRVEKMRFADESRDTIIFNSRIRVSGIPEKAYRYVVNGRSAIEWVMERYMVRTDKASGIVNDCNDWCDEVGNARYVLDLLLRVVAVSVGTVEVLEGV